MTDERDDSGMWAVSSLVIRSAVLSVDEIGQRVGQATTNPKLKDVWVADLEPSESVPLDEQLALVEQFLINKIEILEELTATCELNLHLGWTPDAGQDRVVFGQTLIRLLNRLDAFVILDTYTGSG